MRAHITANTGDRISPHLSLLFRSRLLLGKDRTTVEYWYRIFTKVTGAFLQISYYDEFVKGHTFLSTRNSVYRIHTSDFVRGSLLQEYT